MDKAVQTIILKFHYHTHFSKCAAEKACTRAAAEYKCLMLSMSLCTMHTLPSVLQPAPASANGHVLEVQTSLEGEQTSAAAHTVSVFVVILTPRKQ